MGKCGFGLVGEGRVDRLSGSAFGDGVTVTGRDIEHHSEREDEVTRGREV